MPSAWAAARMQDPQPQLEGVRVLVAHADGTLARQLQAATETPDAHR